MRSGRRSLRGAGFPLSTPISISRDCSGRFDLEGAVARHGRPKSSGWISYSVISPFFSSPTSVAAPRLTSSMPSRAIHHQRMLGAQALQGAHLDTHQAGMEHAHKDVSAPAGLVSGPRMLKMVRTPSSFSAPGPRFHRSDGGWART